MNAAAVNAGMLDVIFDRVRIISLVSRDDRRRDVINELMRIGLAPGTGRVEFFDAIKPADAGSFPSIGARGCFMSHLSILEEARNDGVGSLLILEDDVAFVRDIADKLSIINSLLEDSNWDLFYGGYDDIPLGSRSRSDSCLVSVDPDIAIRLTHCIGFRGSAIGEAASFLRDMSERPAGSRDGGPMHVDGAYSWYRRVHPGRRTLVASPAIAYQRPSRSDIFEGLAFYDRVNFLKPLLLFARRWKHLLRRR